MSTDCIDDLAESSSCVRVYLKQRNTATPQPPPPTQHKHTRTQTTTNGKRSAAEWPARYTALPVDELAYVGDHNNLR